MSFEFLLCFSNLCTLGFFQLSSNTAIEQFFIRVLTYCVMFMFACSIVKYRIHFQRDLKKALDDLMLLEKQTRLVCFLFLETCIHKDYSMSQS